ncbi:yippee family protein [Coniochaeta sp. 2T2.1]|nr:yippee family protein [Coniochaeta sp. 2T2.1]
MSPSTDRVHIFPHFLLPSFTIPFRRRRTASSSNISPVPSLSSSPTSTISDSGPASPTEQGPAPLDWADSNDGCRAPPSTTPHGTIHRPQPDTIRCGSCSADLAFGAQIVSKGFTGRYGRAFLALDESELLNIKIGSRENRQLVTGAHVVADISCAVCGTKVGWKYVEATEAAQKYKEGKFILETQRVVVYRAWEDLEGAGRESVEYTRRQSFSLRNSVNSDSDDKTTMAQASNESGDLEQEVTFDSGDEDECEDIFAGTWDPAVVVQRRKKKVSRLRGKKR